ncbi:MAG: NUDIX domain-containing protein [Alloprevotella sp.]|nr:NUDIX domain-containing protein [Alloprevotella sp.]
MPSARHPLHDFLFCPRCGSSQFEPHDAKAKRCGECGFIFYHNAATAVAAIVTDPQGRLLVTRRAFDPARNTLDLPGGFVDPGEQAEAAVCREVLEETNCRVRVEEFLFSLPNEYIYSGHTVHTTDLFFRCTIEGNDIPTAHDDAAEVIWIPLTELNPAQFGLTSIRQGIERLLKSLI